MAGRTVTNHAGGVVGGITNGNGLVFRIAIKPTSSTPKEQTKQVVMQTVKMPIDGMVCNACQSNVKKTIKGVDGVTDVEVNLEKKFAVFSFDPKKVKVEQVQKAVNDKGFEAGKPQEVKQ